MKISKDNSTRLRLLHAARKVFSEYGLKNATVRDICDLAEANVAAVSYHFGSKEELYIAVIKDHIENMERQYPRNLGVTADSTPEARLRAFVRSHLCQFVGDGDPVNELLSRRLTQEIIEPSRHFLDIFERYCTASRSLLLDIVRAFLPDSDDLTVSRCGSCIIGQCLLFDFAREAITRMSPELGLKADNLDAITDFIMGFSLGGIAAIRAGNPA
ncbi:MAG: hypothetical protein A2051_02200 [Desulfovibrionales bacterium GWA2_65_9]|nr:MAG: hypothetical protein A2051_02200 [Desulfovibrionales bacterium GWA2_65_9]